MFPCYHDSRRPNDYYYYDYYYYDYYYYDYYSYDYYYTSIFDQNKMHEASSMHPCKGSSTIFVKDTLRLIWYSLFWVYDASNLCNYQSLWYNNKTLRLIIRVLTCFTTILCLTTTHVHNFLFRVIDAPYASYATPYQLYQESLRRI